VQICLQKLKINKSDMLTEVLTTAGNCLVLEDNMVNNSVRGQSTFYLTIFLPSEITMKLTVTLRG